MAVLPLIYMMQQDPVNKGEVMQFLQALDGAAPNFLFYAIRSNSNPQVSRQPITQDVLNSFEHWNSQGYNIFYTVNEMNHGAGTGRGNEQVSKFRCIYADDDGKVIPNPYPIPPSAIIESSPGKKQVYWFIDTCSGIDEWDGVQQTLVNYYAGDAQARDAARILRLPGLYNTKDEYQIKPKAKLLSLDNHRYDWAQIIAAFPPSQVVRATGQPIGESLDIRLTLEKFISGENYHNAGISLAGYYYNNGITKREKLIEHLQSLIDIQGDVNDPRFNHRRNVDVPGSVDWIIKERKKEMVELVPVKDIFNEEAAPPNKYTALPEAGGGLYEIVQWVKTLQRYPNPTIATIVAEHLVSVFGGGHYHIQNNTTTRKRIMLAPMGTGKNTIVRALSKLVTALEGLNPGGMPYVNKASDFIGSDSFSFSTQHKQVEQHRVRSFVVNEAGESGKSKSGDIDNLRAYQLQALSTKADEAFYPKKFSEQGKFDTEKQMQTVYNGVWVYMHESTLKSYASLLQNAGAFANGDLSRSDIFFVNPHVDPTDINEAAGDEVPYNIIKIFTNLAQDFNATATQDGTMNSAVWEAVDTIEIDADLRALERTIVKERNVATHNEDEVQIAMLGRKHERILTSILICSLADAARGENTMGLPKAQRHHLEYAIRRAGAIDAALLYHASRGGVLSDDPFDQATKQFVEKFKELSDNPKDAIHRMHQGTRPGSQGKSWILNYTVFTRLLQRGPYQGMVKNVYRDDNKRARTAFMEHLEGLEFITALTEIGSDNKVRRVANRWYLNDSMFPVKPVRSKK